ncbi:MAG: bifunctional UDP-N-acetylglucosamine diphosphorylase/glucosamine-1-phosphate N-acetyltransferase GlmU [Nitrospirae bacterium]|nr:bifunctional UDP-N-acetylglucosamine diphosphorylase/glucosamine-1-phosphate N-acetyltransferase GlmU [Nitrospirota bacterium]
MTTCAVILAAGLGKRMKSATPKVVHSLFNKPIVTYPVEAVKAVAGVSKIVLVIGRHSEERLKDIFKEDPMVSFAYQTHLLGTADALKSGLGTLDGGQFDYTLVMTADAPLIRGETLQGLIDRHITGGNAVTVLSFVSSNPSSYGRVMRNPGGTIKCIIENPDASDEERKINEVNSGIYVFSRDALPLLDKIAVNAKKGEFYLTDIVSIANEHGLKVEAQKMLDEDEFIGINSRAELLMALNAMKLRTNRHLMAEGVTLMDENTTLISPGVAIGRDTIIYPNVILEGKTQIGEGCVIYSNVRIVNSTIEADVVVKDSTLIEDSAVQSGAAVGPFAHLRPGAVIGKKAKVGNFVEIKKSTLGYNTKASHLSYIGDASVGDNVNIGAGTITCNYDGVNKFKTVIEDGVFIGSDSQLVAPVTIGKGAFVGAGSTITQDVPSDALALSRVRQRTILDWVKAKFSTEKHKT